MEKYTAIKAITFSVGEKIEMNDEQYQRRIDCVDRTDVDNVYIVKTHTSFKIGEVIGYDGEANKILLQTLQPVKPDNASKPDKPGNAANEGSKKGKGK